MTRTSTVKLLLLLCFLLVSAKAAFAQFSLSAEVRPRAELRNGFKSVKPEGESPAFFIEQRSRLNLNHRVDRLQLRLSLQDVRVWGNTSQIYKADPALFNVYEAYGEYALTSTLAVRVGRQELNYDNARFLGNLDWAQQGRSHDAIKFIYADSTGFALHAGAGFNQSVPSEPVKLTGTFYGGLDNYKTMQYLWLHKEWSGGAKLSVLFFNDGRQRPDSTVAHRQTYGFLGEKKIGPINFAGEVYFQGGKDPAGKSVSAFLAAASATVATPLTPLTFGADYLSGSDDQDTRNRSFAPLYGTNHAFYGLMDYFYVGSNHGQNGRTAGLIDIYFKTNFKLGPKGSLLAHVHHFKAPSTVYAAEPTGGELSSRLGEELDLVYNLNVRQDFNFKAGFSQLYATNSMDALKGVQGKSSNQWAWIMLTFKPVMFSN